MTATPRGAACPSGKRSYTTYAAALAALVRLDGDDLLRGPVGSVYQCTRCEGGWHISSRKFTLAKRRGRGKSRRGFVEHVS